MTDPMTGRTEGVVPVETPITEPAGQTDELACELAEEWNSAEPPSDSAGS